MRLVEPDFKASLLSQVRPYFFEQLTWRLLPRQNFQRPKAHGREEAVLIFIRFGLLPTLFVGTLMPFFDQGVYERMIEILSPDYAAQTRRLASETVSYWYHLVLGTVFGVAAILQFSQRLRRTWPLLHRISGYTMVLSAAALNVSGLMMAWFTPFAPVGEFLASLVFLTLPGMVFYGLGIAAARRKNFVQHRTYMVLGTAGTGSILLQRPTLSILDHLLDTPVNQLFLVNGFVCFLLSLTMAAVLIRSKSI